MYQNLELEKSDLMVDGSRRLGLEVHRNVAVVHVCRFYTSCLIPLFLSDVQDWRPTLDERQNNHLRG